MLYITENISLEDLEKANWLSERAINVCKLNNFSGLRDIISFYKKFNSFKNLTNCGNKTEKELTELLVNFSNNSENEIFEIIKDRFYVKELVRKLSTEEAEASNKHIEYLLFKLTVRGRNGLLSLFNKTPDVFELVDIIYTPSFNLKSIRNIGEKTVLELEQFTESLILFIKSFDVTEIITNISSSSPQSLNTLFQVNYESIIAEFNPFKKAALNRHIDYLLSTLSVRARNGINQFFGENLTAKELIGKIYSYSFSFQNLRNIGSKSLVELNNFRRDITLFIETLRTAKDDELSKEYTKLIIKNNFRKLSLNFNVEFEMIFNGEGKILLFKLIHYLIENAQIINQKEKELFLYLYTNNNKKSLEQIARDLELTKERIRQLRIVFENNIQNYFRFILNFNIQDLVSYDISQDTEFVIINNQFIKTINEVESVNFNTLFFSKIFGIFLEESHLTLGDNETISGTGNYSNTIRYKNCYLIEKKIFGLFDFERFVTDVSHNRTKKNTQTYSLHFEGYLVQFLALEGRRFFSVIKNICESILYNEFDMIVNISGYIVFERNVRKPLTEYTYEILQQLGKMTRIEDILKVFNEKYPDIIVTEQSIRSTLQRDKELYIYIGRSSTYGLKKWEIENGSVKGGTIRDIVEEYLEKNDSPKHIYDIVNYVNQYRKTSQTSIFRNIQAEDSNRFKFFDGGYVGLKRKAYSASDLIFKRVIGAAFSKRSLRNFNGWDYDQVISYYVNKYNYAPVQVKNLIETKIQSGVIKLNDDKTIQI